MVVLNPKAAPIRTQTSFFPKASPNATPIQTQSAFFLPTLSEGNFYSDSVRLFLACSVRRQPLFGLSPPFPCLSCPNAISIRTQSAFFSPALSEGNLYSDSVLPFLASPVRRQPLLISLKNSRHIKPVNASFGSVTQTKKEAFPKKP